MFTFQFLDFLIVLTGGLILFAGLTLLALRRRSEVLREFLTPEEPDIEKEFFRRREKMIAAMQPVVEEPVEPEPEEVVDESGWGVDATTEEQPPQA